MSLSGEWLRPDSPMQLQRKLQALIHQIDPDSPRQCDELRLLLALHPMEFRTWAVAWICNGGRGPRAYLLLRLLHQKDMLRSLLVNPGAIPLRDAVRVARLAQHSIANLDWIIADTIREGTVTQAARALRVLQHVPLTGRVVPGLAAALRDPNPKIRSLVSKLLGRICDDPASIHALLQDRDARVRANTVEGFWGSNHPVARDLMRRCLGDADNRVATNAALGLYKAGDPDGIEAFRILSSHPNPRHRMSAAWGITQTADRALLPELEVLAEDRISKVREAAGAALARLRNPRRQQGEPGLLVKVSQVYRRAEGGLRLSVFVTDPDDNPMENLAAESFRVSQGEVALPAQQVQAPAQGDGLITIVWLSDESLDPEVRTKAHSTIVGAMRHRRKRDLHCAVGPGLHAALAFSADLGQLDGALKQAGSDARPVPDWSERLFRAVTLASSRAGCPAVVAFSGGSRLEGSMDVDRFIQQALKCEIAVHVVVYATQGKAAAEWQHIASATQGTYRLVGDEDQLQHAFWYLFAQLSGSYSITVSGVSGERAEFRLAVRSTAGDGETWFEPLPQQSADAVPTAVRHVK
jgi:HEAT repeat protein